MQFAIFIQKYIYVYYSKLIYINIYGDSLKETFLNILGMQKKKNTPLERPRSKLSFIITDDYPDKVLEKSGEWKIIGTRGREMLYSLYALGLDRKAYDTAERIKGALIERRSLLGYPKEIGTNEAIQGSIEESKLLVGGDSRDIIGYIVGHDTLGYGPISILLEEPKDIEEIVINSPESNIGIYHSRYGYCKTNMRFANEDQFRFIINKLISKTEKELGMNSPIIDAQLDNGSRLHAQLKPYAVNGAMASIRLSGSKSIDLKRLIKNGTATPEILAYLWIAVESKFNIVFSGAPASGKTTFMLAANSFLPRYERIITIEEDVNELKFYSNFMNVVSLQGLQNNIHIKDQVVNALHLRPDRLIVGEIRGGEAREVFFGANVGVPFMTTLHSAIDENALIGRLESKPMLVDPALVSMLDIAFFMKQDGITTRRIDRIIEYKWRSRDEIGLKDGLQEYFASAIDPTSFYSLERIGSSKVMKKFASLHMLKSRDMVKEFKKRAVFLKKLGDMDDGISIPEYISGYWDL